MAVEAQERAELGRRRVAAIAAAIACVAVVGVGLSLSVPLLSLEMERMGASSTLIGVNTAMAGLAGALFVPVVPRLVARFGLIGLLWACIAVSVATLIGFRALFQIAWWFPLRFVFAAALATLFVLAEFWINEAAPRERRGLVMGVYATALGLAFSAGPALLAVVGSEGWPPYLAGAGLLALAATPLLVARGLSPEPEGKAGHNVAWFLRVAPLATLAALIFGAVETGGFALLPIYGLRLGLPGEAATLLVSALALGNVVFQIPIGLASDRIDRRLVLLFIAAVGLIGATLIPAASGHVELLVLLLFVWGGVTGALYTVGLAHLGARFAGADLVGANAAFVLLYNLGLVVGPPLVGAGMDLVPPHGFAWTLAALFGVYLVVVGRRLAARHEES